ncbi:unnamed protein product [Caenorhabditis sp. 36 PRJEB53466]|nr:unnamed protein product [Caenorhabditis sp. 36 PRJEB53466]
MQAAPVLLLTVASLAAVLGAPAEEVKSEAAAGRHHRPPHGGFPPHFWQPLIQDRFVCDLDASVLLVVDSNRHHHRNPYFGAPANRAVRVKCSEVANNDEDSCKLCCQQTARRDTSLPNEKLFGFLAITKINDDETFTRTKRDAEDDDDDDDEDEKRRRNGGGRFHKVDSTYVVEAKWTPDAYNTNVKCVCCAPRSNPAAQNPSTYSNTASSPPAQSPYGSSSGSSNTFGNPQPITANPASSASAQQPLVDSWQSESAATWGAASDAPASAPAVTPAPATSTY